MSDPHVQMRINLDSDRVTRIDDHVVMVDLGTVDDAVRMILMTAVCDPDKAVMLKEMSEVDG